MDTYYTQIEWYAKCTKINTFNGLGRNGQLYYLDQNKDCDVVKLDYLQFVLNQDVSVHSFIEMITGLSFVVKIDESVIWNIKIDFMCCLEPCKKHGNSIFVKIPDYLIQDIKVVCIEFHSIKYNIEYDTNIFSYEIGILPHETSILTYEIKLIYHTTCLSTYTRRDISYKQHKIPIQQLQTIDFNLQESVLTIEKPCLFKYTSKGYFVQGNIDKLVGFELLSNGYSRISYNIDLIKLYCFKISDRLLYISFENINNIKDVHLESFRGGFDQILYKNIVAKLTFSEPQKRCSIHSLTYNILEYNHGMVKII